MGNGLWVMGYGQWAKAQKGDHIIKGFRGLKVWQEGKELAVELYKETQNGSFERDFSLKDQIRRAAVSIASNIAEGDERGTNKEAVRFFYMSKGSLAELQTQLEIAFAIGYIDEATYRQLDKKCASIGKMLGSLIKFRSKK
jgi:four helix bundle protein